METVKPLLFRHVRPPPPTPRRSAAHARPDLSIGPRWLLGRGRLGAPGGRAATGAGARPDAGRGGPERLLPDRAVRSEEHTSELQSRLHLVCRLLLEKK